jgi:excisionase family DNA binding protein
MPESEFLTVKEAAARLRMSPSWLYLQVETGQIPHIRFGSSIRFVLGTLNNWIAKTRSMNAVFEKYRAT